MFHKYFNHNRKTALIVKAVTGSVFITTLGVGVFAFAFPLLAKDRGITGIWLGLAFSGYFFAKLALAPLTGALSDRFGPRPLLLISSVAGVLFPGIYFFIIIPDELIILYIIQIGLGIVSGIIKPVGMAVLGAETPETERGRVFSIYNLFFYIAQMTAPLLGGFLYIDHKTGPVITFLLITMAFSLVILLFFLPGDIASSKRYEDREENPSLKKENRLEFMYLLAAVTGRTAGRSIVISFLPVILWETLPYNTVLFGLVMAVPGIITCLSLPFSGKLADGLNRKMLTFTGMFICAICLIFLGKADTLPEFIIISIIMGAGSVISLPASMSLASGLGSNQGKIMGFFHSVANLGFIIGPLAGGIAAKKLGTDGAFSLIGIAGILSCMPVGINYLRSSYRMKKKYTAILASVCLTTVFIASFIIFNGKSNNNSNRTFHFANIALGNIARLTIVAEDENTAGKAADKAFETIHEHEKDFNYRNKNGSIGSINASSGKKSVEISTSAFNLIERSILLSKKTGGIFDINVGAYTTGYFFYEKDFPEKNKDLVDYRKIKLNHTEKTVFLPVKGMAIDTGGLAKGTIIDLAAESLKKSGIEKGIVEIGGDFICFGNKNWKVGIQHPREESLLGVISNNNMGICGSGDYYQYVMDNTAKNARKHHIIDPRKMKPSRTSIGVTVISKNAETADALATTMFIMGPDKGKTVLREKFPESSALWVLPDLTIIKTQNFPDFLKE